MATSPESGNIKDTNAQNTKRRFLKRRHPLTERTVFSKILSPLFRKEPAEKRAVTPTSTTSVEKTLTTIVKSETPPDPQLAQFARDLFIEVSILHPSNFLTQAAAIVRRCLEFEYDPDDLKMALVRTPELLENIRIAANHRHSRARREKTDNLRLPEDISQQHNIYTIAHVFNWANTIKILTVEELQEIENAYPIPITSSMEAGIYAKEGLERIERRKRELGLSTEDNL